MAFNKKTIEDIDVSGKKVLVRCDFNVPLKDGHITDENRLIGALPTIKYLIQNNARVILCSHLGKPKGEPKPELSLEPVAERLSEMLKRKVVFAADDNVVGENAKRAVRNMKDGDVILLQNTRYRIEETKNEDSFSKELASLAEIFVNDAFGTAHRAHCSTVGVTKFLSTAVCGYLIQKEIKFLGDAVENPKRPFVAILGGAKISDKINVINNLLEKVDVLIIGGGMSYTFSKAQGHTVGNSMVEEDKIKYAKEMIDKAKSRNVKLLLPLDNVVTDKFDANAKPIVTETEDIGDGYMGLDIGPKTCKLYESTIAGAKTIVWNGPMGMFEKEEFSNGTRSVAEAIARSSAFSLAGGGDTGSALDLYDLRQRMSYVSTGGGAFLEKLAGRQLPAIKALEDRMTINA